MILVLADDFSGAAEIGGIGHRYGLLTEIQLTLDMSSTAELIVLDTDTRSLSKEDAEAKIFEVASTLKKFKEPFFLFKKIDSVMRGHLIPELNVLQDCFAFNRILLLPANPGRGRKIIGGEYFLGGIRLQETVFSTDPDFPIFSSRVSERVNSYTSTLPHVHVSAHDLLPPRSIVTGDVESKTDLKNYVRRIESNDLCCGAAELFESYLEHLGFTQQEQAVADESNALQFTLIINGSTVKNQKEKDWLDHSTISRFSLPGTFEGPEFRWPADASDWFAKVLNALHERNVVAVTIDHPVHHNKILSEKFLMYFVALVRYITQEIAFNRINFCLTGGATASALIRNFAEGKLMVKEEIAPGVVSLATRRGRLQQGCFTVKPGSYEWPSPLLERFAHGK